MSSPAATRVSDRDLVRIDFGCFVGSRLRRVRQAARRSSTCASAVGAITGCGGGGAAVVVVAVVPVALAIDGFGGVIAIRSANGIAGAGAGLFTTIHAVTIVAATTTPIAIEPRQLRRRAQRTARLRRRARRAERARPASDRGAGLARRHDRHAGGIDRAPSRRVRAPPRRRREPARRSLVILDRSDRFLRAYVVRDLGLRRGELAARCSTPASARDAACRRAGWTSRDRSCRRRARCSSSWRLFGSARC